MKFFIKAFTFLLSIGLQACLGILPVLPWLGGNVPIADKHLNALISSLLHPC